MCSGTLSPFLSGVSYRRFWAHEAQRRWGMNLGCGMEHLFWNQGNTGNYRFGWEIPLKLEAIMFSVCSKALLSSSLSAQTNCSTPPTQLSRSGTLFLQNPCRFVQCRLVAMVVSSLQGQQTGDKISLCDVFEVSPGFRGLGFKLCPGSFEAKGNALLL